MKSRRDLRDRYPLHRTRCGHGYTPPMPLAKRNRALGMLVLNLLALTALIASAFQIARVWS